MNRIFFAAACAALAAAAAAAPEGRSATTELWYAKSAGNWLEALPVGNGRMGAMVFGGDRECRIQFNESSVWTGRPHDYAREVDRKKLDGIRGMIFAGYAWNATEESKELMGDPATQKMFMPCGDAWVRMRGLENPAYGGRRLDLVNGMHSFSFTDKGVRYVEETFAPHDRPDLLVHRVASSKPGALSCEIAVGTPHGRDRRSSVEPGRSPRVLVEATVEEDGVKFAILAELRAEGRGAKCEARGDGTFSVEGADSAELRIVAKTNAKSWRELGGDPAALARKAMSAQSAAPFGKIRASHVAEFSGLMKRVRLELGPAAPDAASTPTDERLKRQPDAADPSFAALAFNYGRYLLASSSRPGGEPANLQGIWNDSTYPPWGSKMTSNINVEMNYWPAEVAALGECHDALFKAVEELAVSGSSAARKIYGADGFVVHHNFDFWRGAAPVDFPPIGIWTVGGAWLSLHFWEHYRFTLDRKFLSERAWPVMAEAARFFTQTLAEHPKTRTLVTNPSYSPEHGLLVAGASMDMQLVRALYTAILEASKILGRRDALVETVERQLPRLDPLRVGKWGQLQEWMDDVDDPKDTHRHISHLWALYPGDEINWRTKKRFDAARTSLAARGDEATGWSMGWKINLWARLGDGDHAMVILRNLLRPQSGESGGLYPNLFDAHPPFQIDGNFGAAAGIAEMLLQSHVADDDGNIVIDILPALPSAWKTGRVSGLRARGNFAVDVEWSGGKAVKTRVKSFSGTPAVVRLNGRLVRLKPEKGETVL